MKQKISSSFVNMAGVLFLVTLISALALSSVYNATRSKIEEASQGKQLEALKQVIMTSYNNNPYAEKEEIEGSELYLAKQDDTITTIAIKAVSNKGYSGDIEVMVGLLPNGEVSNLVVVAQTETPGLGTKVTEDSFLSQFRGRNLADFILKVKKDGGDVDAVSGATISSRAVSDAIANAYNSFIKGGFNE